MVGLDQGSMVMADAEGSYLLDFGYQASCPENVVPTALLVKMPEQRKAAEHHAISA